MVSIRYYQLNGRGQEETSLKGVFEPSSRVLRAETCSLKTRRSNFLFKQTTADDNVSNMICSIPTETREFRSKDDDSRRGYTVIGRIRHELSHSKAMSIWNRDSPYKVDEEEEFTTFCIGDHYEARIGMLIANTPNLIIDSE